MEGVAVFDTMVKGTVVFTEGSAGTITQTEIYAKRDAWEPVLRRLG